MIFAILTAKTAVFSRRMKLDGVLHFCIYAFATPPKHICLFFLPHGEECYEKEDADCWGSDGGIAAEIEV